MTTPILDSSAEDLLNQKKQKPLFYLLKYGGILMACWLTEMVVVEFGRYVLSTELSLKLSGAGALTLMVLHFVVLILALKSFIRAWPGTGILMMTFLGTAICFFAIVIPTSISVVQVCFFGMEWCTWYSHESHAYLFTLWNGTLILYRISAENKKYRMADLIDCWIPHIIWYASGDVFSQLFAMKFWTIFRCSDILKNIIASFQQIPHSPSPRPPPDPQPLSFRMK